MHVGESGGDLRNVLHDDALVKGSQRDGLARLDGLSQCAAIGILHEDLQSGRRSSLAPGSEYARDARMREVTQDIHLQMQENLRSARIASLSCVQSVHACLLQSLLGGLRVGHRDALNAVQLSLVLDEVHARLRALAEAAHRAEAGRVHA